MSRTSPGRWTPAEVVPLADRLRYMSLVRATMIVAVLAFGVFVPGALGVGLGTLARGTAVFFVVSALAEAAWRLRRRRGLRLFGTMLLVDGVYLAWVAYVTGGTGSALRYLVLLHLIAVTLLASYRTGLKLALWHSLLVFVVFYAGRSGLLSDAGRVAAERSAANSEQLSVFIVVVWLATFVVAACSAANERELRRRRFDLEALAKMASQLETAPDSLAAAEIVLDRVIDTFDASRALVLAAPDGSLRLLAARGTPEGAAPIGTSLECGPGSVIERARDSRSTVLARDLLPDDDPVLAELLPEARNLVVLPLSAEGRWIGVLLVEHSARGCSRIERRAVSMLERFASHAGLALRNAWLLEQVQRLADTDGLTGIANRRTFEDVLAREVLRAAHRHEALSLVMLDIDHFKDLNDLHGHQAGDEVLRDVAAILTQHCRDTDTPARYGGEEFALILPRCSAGEAMAMAERLRLAVEGANMVVPITVSLGVADFPRRGDDGAALVRAADHALYASKRAGRNRATGADDAPVTAPEPAPGELPEAIAS